MRTAELQEQFTLVRSSVERPANAEQIVLLDLTTKGLKLLERQAALVTALWEVHEAEALASHCTPANCHIAALLDPQPVEP